MKASIAREEQPTARAEPQTQQPAAEHQTGQPGGNTGTDGLPPLGDRPYGFGREKGLFMDKSDRKAKWQKYMVSLQDPGPRPSKIAHAPAEIKPRLQTANDKSWWFVEWVKAGSNWACVNYQEVLSQLQQDSEGTTKEWVTRPQAIHIFRDPVVGNAVCDAMGQSVATTRRHTR